MSPRLLRAAVPRAGAEESREVRKYRTVRSVKIKAKKKRLRGVYQAPREAMLIQGAALGLCHTAYLGIFILSLEWPVSLR